MVSVLKKFTLKLVAFSFFVIIIFISLYFIGFFKNKYQFNLHRTEINYKDVYIGDSHIQLSIDPDLVKHAVNLGQICETYDYTFYKLKYLVDNNIMMKQVFLGVDSHNFSSNLDIYNYNNFQENFRSRYFYILPFKENLNFCYDHFPTIIDLFKEVYLKNYSFHDYKDYNHTFLGGYSNDFINNTIKPKEIYTRIQGHYYFDDKYCSISNNNSRYFDSIVYLCKKNKLKLTLLVTPVHAYYDSLTPTLFKDFFKEKCIKSGCPIITFNPKNYSEDCFYIDGDHLTKKGVTILSKELAHLLYTKD